MCILFLNWFIILCVCHLVLVFSWMFVLLPFQLGWISIGRHYLSDDLDDSEDRSKMEVATKKMSLPSSPLPSLGPANVVHSGYLNKLSGKSLLYPGSWKRRYCVLDSMRLYYYESKEDTTSSPDKTHNYINLEYYDSCEEANSKDIRKATNVFVISSSDKTFFESGRLYFSAETLTEMNDWIGKIRHVMETLQKTPKKRNPCKNMKAAVEEKLKTSKSNSTCILTEEKSSGETCIPQMTSSHKETNPTDLTISTSETDHLECITKQRAKGPAGRRLPRQRFTTASESDGSTRQKRSGSLSLLEVESTSSSNRIPAVHNRSFDLGAEERWSMTTRQKAIFKPVYTYSSSEDSLNGSFTSNRLDSSLKSGRPRPSVSSSTNGGVMPTGYPDESETKLKSLHYDPDSETVETLCEIPNSKLHSSTPSLSQNPFHKSALNWQSIGSSSTAPCLMRQKRRNHGGSIQRHAIQPTPSSLATLSELEHMWTRPAYVGDNLFPMTSVHHVDDSLSSIVHQDKESVREDTTDNDPSLLSRPFIQILQQLQGQTSMFKSTLNQMESQSMTCQRDIGSLQENLMTVQSAASNVADKVSKMQSQVANMERQVLNAIKEAHNLQQKANEVLNAACEAEKDFRRLENECKTLLSDLRNRNVEEDHRDKSDPEIVSPYLSPFNPINPNPASSLKSIQSPVSNPPLTLPQFQMNFTSSPNLNRPLKFNLTDFNVPKTFDFTTLLSKNNVSTTTTTTPCQEIPKIKSSLRSETKTGPKSISFGPTTTFSSSDDQRHSLVIPDFIIPAATSTLRKHPSTDSTDHPDHPVNNNLS